MWREKERKEREKKEKKKRQNAARCKVAVGGAPSAHFVWESFFFMITFLTVRCYCGLPETTGCSDLFGWPVPAQGTSPTHNKTQEAEQ